MEELNLRLSWIEEQLHVARVLRLQAVKEKNEMEKKFKRERSLKHRHKRKEQRLREELEKVEQPCRKSSNKLQVPSELH